MDHSHDAALRILEETYNSEIVQYLRKVIRAESRHSDFEASDIISIAFIVLERTKQKFDTSKGQFTNYAIRSLKNELIRTKQHDFFLYDDDGTESLSGTVSTSDSLYSTLGDSETLTELELDRELRESDYAAMAAVLSQDLTPLEKSLIYIAFYSTEFPRSISFKHISTTTCLPHSGLVSSYRRGFQKLRSRLNPSNA